MTNKLSKRSKIIVGIFFLFGANFGEKIDGEDFREQKKLYSSINIRQNMKTKLQKQHYLNFLGIFLKSQWFFEKKRKFEDFR